MIRRLVAHWWDGVVFRLEQRVYEYAELRRAMRVRRMRGVW